MRTPCLLLAAWLLAGWAARADEQLITRFDGHSSLTTADFTVPAGWELRWRSDQLLSLGIIRRDNTVIAGTTGRNIGSLFLPQGGTFRIRVKGDDQIPWDVAIYALDKNPEDEANNDYYVPTPGPDYRPETADTNAPPAPPDNTAASAPPATDTPVPAQPPAPPPLPTQLSADQLRCFVLIKGDRLQGTGFFVRLGKEKVIVTTQDLIANNPNWKVVSALGNPLEVMKVEGATDRDVALLTVKDYGFPALDIGSMDAVHAGDAVLTGGAAGAPLPPSTDIIAVGSQHLDIDQLTAPPGCPVVLARSGQVVGVVASEPQLTESVNFGTQNFDERDSSVDGSIATHGLRVDNIPARETYDLARLQVQNQFLDTFHQHSRSLDAFLNGTGSAADLHLWQGDDKLKTANDNFVQDTAGGDPAARKEAFHAMLFELGLAADADLDQAQQPANFYAYPGLRAKDETVYRQALKAQLDAFGNNLNSFNTVMTRNNPN